MDNNRCAAPARTSGRPACLLEVLQFRVGCMYLSDLHIPANLPLIRQQLQRIDPACFAVEEWNDAAAYITGERVQFGSCADAAAYLLAWKPAAAAEKKKVRAGGSL